jgi:hypothetical protein
MFWGKPGAEHVLALRCIGANRRLDAFWKDRLNTLAARNDCLLLLHRRNLSCTHSVETVLLGLDLAAVMLFQ